MNLNVTSIKRSRVLIVAAFAVLGFSCKDLLAQSGLRESLERLDVDGDGRIEPEEITPLSRPYLERIAKARRLSLDRDNRIETLQEAARVYFALQNGVAGSSKRSEGRSTIQSFEPASEDPLIPEFGLPNMKYPYIQDDMDEADQTLRRYDRDDDGFINRREAERARWTHLDPFASDIDKDDRLSRLELGQRYARRRLLSDVAGELVQKSQRIGSEVRPTSRNERREDQSQWWRRGGSSYWLTAAVLGRFDANRNGRLESGEAQNLGISFGRLDIDRDGELSREELHAYLTKRQDEEGDATLGLPAWFYELDVDRDGQVAMPEFAQEWTASKMLEFSMLDSNEDGLLTASEVAGASSMSGGTFTNDEAEVLPPHKTIISTIEVDDDFTIGDLNVRLSITHTHTSHLDGFLTGPDGTRIELFTEVGGSGDHFDKTVFDDQSRYPITKARPPFKGTYMPKGTAEKKPGLSSFNGKSTKGVWELVIRGSRNERFGLLHSWGLVFEPQNADGGFTITTTPTTDGPAADSPEQGNTRAPQIAQPSASKSLPPAGRAESGFQRLSSDYLSLLRSSGEGGQKKADAFERMSPEEREQAIGRYKSWMEKSKMSELKRAENGKSLDRGEKKREKLLKTPSDKKLFRKLEK